MYLLEQYDWAETDEFSLTAPIGVMQVVSLACVMSALCRPLVLGSTSLVDMPCIQRPHTPPQVCIDEQHLCEIREGGWEKVVYHDRQDQIFKFICPDYIM